MRARDRRRPRLRLGGRPAAQPADERHDHLRDARRAASPRRRPPASSNPGTFAGVIEKIPYLKELGVTAVELLPVFEFDEREVRGINPIDGSRAAELLGLQTRQLLRAAGELLRRRPTRARRSPSSATWSRRCTRPGIEVILDVVFNHTGEGNHQGPTISFKGLDNNVYYHLRPDRPAVLHGLLRLRQHGQLQPPDRREVDPRLPASSGSSDMHVDGFRFDVGSILARGEDGAPMEYPAGRLAHRAVREARRHQDHRRGVGRRRPLPGRLLPGLALGGVERPLPRRRPPLRAGDHGLVGDVATRIAGSADIYQAGGQLPINSINFITCHDGFTLNDLVSYNDKHNEANGEGNRDGIDDNLSWNCGVEGADRRPGRRARCATGRSRTSPRSCLLSQGVPMFVAGDEVGRTQQRQQQRLLPGQRAQLVRLDARRAERRPAPLLQADDRASASATPSLRRRAFFTGDVNRARPAGHRAGTASSSTQPGWDDPGSRVLAFTLGGDEPLEPDLHVMMNMDDDAARLRRARTATAGAGSRRRHRRGLARRHRRARQASGRSRASAARSRAAASSILVSQDSLTDPEEGTRHRWTRECTSPSPTRSRGTVVALPGGRGHVHAEDDRRPRVRRSRSRDQTFAEVVPQPRRGVHRRDRPDARHARPRALSCSPTGSSIPEGGGTTFEAKHLVFVGPRRARLRLRAPGLVGQADPRDRATSTCSAQFGRRRDRLRALPHADQRSRATSCRHAGRRPTRSRGWSTASRRPT